MLLAPYPAITVLYDIFDSVPSMELCTVSTFLKRNVKRVAVQVADRNSTEAQTSKDKHEISHF